MGGNAQSLNVFLLKIGAESPKSQVMAYPAGAPRLFVGLRGPHPALFLSVKKEIGRGLGLKAPTVQGLKIPAYFQKEKPYSGYPL